MQTNTDTSNSDASIETLSNYSNLIENLDKESIGGIRMKAVYLSAIVRLKSELYGFDSALSETNKIKSHIPVCETIGHLEYCETIYHSSLGKLYADHGRNSEAETELSKALSLFENHIAAYKNNLLYKDVKSYYAVLLGKQPEKSNNLTGVK